MIPFKWYRKKAFHLLFYGRKGEGRNFKNGTKLLSQFCKFVKFGT